MQPLAGSDVGDSQGHLPHRRYYDSIVVCITARPGASARRLRTCGPLVGVAGCRGGLPATRSPAVAALLARQLVPASKETATILTTISIKLVIRRLSACQWRQKGARTRAGRWSPRVSALSSSALRRPPVSKQPTYSSIHCTVCWPRVLA